LIDFYTASTVNGFKVAIALEELGLPYTVHDLNLGELEQKKPDYLKINPNGRIPAIVDRESGTAIFESGACLVYLADKTGKLTGATPEARGRVNSWVFLQTSGVGPMQGQANVFLHYFGEDLPRVVDRYVNETKRLYNIFNEQLATNEWLAGDHHRLRQCLAGRLSPRQGMDRAHARTASRAAWPGRAAQARNR
jgi:glutathione S-transferase